MLAGARQSSFVTNVWIGPFCLKLVLSCSSIVRLCKLFNAVGRCFVFCFLIVFQAPYVCDNFTKFCCVVRVDTDKAIMLFTEMS